jgi:hypothetical protein
MTCVIFDIDGTLARFDADRLGHLVHGVDKHWDAFHAAMADAPPILQWNNGLSWYIWNGGSDASQWGLSYHHWATLWSIIKKPCHWNGNNFAHFGAGVFFLIAGAKESRFNGGLALFPETLRSELHQVRSTIEAYSRKGVLENQEGPHAAGVAMDAGSSSDVRLRVRTCSGKRWI